MRNVNVADNLRCSKLWLSTGSISALSFDRALILHETAEIAIAVSMNHEAYITPDGQDGISVEDGDMVMIKKDDHASYFARVESAGYFYRRLMARLGYIRQD